MTLPLNNGAKLPDQDHVLRHVPTKRLITDDDGNIIGMFPEAMTPRPQDNKALSVNWLEYHKADHDTNLVSTINLIRSVRTIAPSSKCGYALYNVQQLKELAQSISPLKVVYNGNDPNFSHSQIKNVSPEDATLLDLLCESTLAIIPNENIE